MCLPWCNCGAVRQLWDWMIAVEKKKQKQNTPFQWWCDPHTVFRSKVGCTCPGSCASLPEINSNFSISAFGLDLTELPELVKHIQRADNLVTWIIYIALISVACIQDVTTANHWSQACPHQKRIRLQASKFISTCCTIWAPVSRGKKKKACFYECERYVALASHWAGLPDDLAALRTAAVGGGVGIVINNCSITWTNGLRVIKMGWGCLLKVH